ncbi:unnamed protein product [Calicophoron daubneyi]|uniref:G2/mitotic-specific cyclin-B3 n=1 Tax=Calicophoron daubneyi TaxID=300641 RepID=A0AAV2TJZ7_CALDB
MDLVSSCERKENQYNGKAQDAFWKVPCSKQVPGPISGMELCARPVLGNLTNKLENRNFNSKCPSYQDYQKSSQAGDGGLTGSSIVNHPQSFSKSVKGHLTEFDRVDHISVTYPALPSPRPESGYYSINADEKHLSFNKSVSSDSSVLASLNSSLVSSNAPESKRPRFVAPEAGSDPYPLNGRPKAQTVDESEIDRRPFKSKLACDIVRAAFGDRVQLEELLDECRRADFALSAVDRSPIDRMMEATDYIVGIMAYEQMREKKECFRVGDFLAAGKQPNLTADMLTTLADWLIEVQENFAFNHETIHLAWGLLYAYFDRGQQLARREIQLMACAAIMVACKHEERQMPQMSEFLYITDNAYTKEEFCEAERRLLTAIDFAVHRPNPYVFLRRYARVLDAHSGLVQYMSRFLLEAGMHCHTISLKRESRKAAAVLWLARVVLRNPSYVDWIRREDVRQLRQVLRTNRASRVFYSKCGHSVRSASKSNSVCSPTSALDLSSASFAVRTVSLGDSNSTSSEGASKWIDRQDSSNHASTMSRTTGGSNLDERQVSSGMDSSTRLGNFEPEGIDLTLTWEDVLAELDADIRGELEAMKLEEEQRSPLWPPILQHITGYKESDLVPLAVRYHAIAMRLIAEVARGSVLASRKESSAVRVSKTCDAATCIEEDEDDPDPSGQSGQRCLSPGGHYLRRQSVTKYCSDAFLNVADAYPQLAFENFVPHFPSVQCPDLCSCFVCVNLIRRTT